jgi:hypothetical protein
MLQPSPTKAVTNKSEPAVCEELSGHSGGRFTDRLIRAPPCPFERRTLRLDESADDCRAACNGSSIDQGIGQLQPEAAS